jgi:hypothetical protein
MRDDADHTQSDEKLSKQSHHSEKARDRIKRFVVALVSGGFLMSSVKVANAAVTSLLVASAPSAAVIIQKRLVIESNDLS